MPGCPRIHQSPMHIPLMYTLWVILLIPLVAQHYAPIEGTPNVMQWGYNMGLLLLKSGIYYNFFTTMVMMVILPDD